MVRPKAAKIQYYLQDVRGGYQKARFGLRQSGTQRSSDIRFLAFQRQKTNVKKRKFHAAAG
jgi:hypothetical protein